MISGSINSLDVYVPKHERDRLQWENWQLFQQDIDNRLRMFNDDWTWLLARYISQQVSEETAAAFFPRVLPNTMPEDWADNSWPRWPLPTHINLQKRVIEEMSLVYHSEATRNFCDSVEVEDSMEVQGLPITAPRKRIVLQNDQRFNQIATYKYNSQMQLVNKLTNLCSTTVVRPVIDYRSPSGFRLDIITPDMYTPIQHPDDPSTLIGLLYTIDLTDSHGNDITTRREYLFYMGTETEEPFWMMRDNYHSHEKDAPVKNPWPYFYKGKKYLPFVVFRREPPLLGEFINRTRGRDLYFGTLQTAYLASLFIRAFQASTGKQIVITGASAGTFTPKSWIRDTLAVWTFPFDKSRAQIEQVDNERNFLQLWEALEKHIESILTNYGISLSNFKGTQSGISIVVQNEKIINIIEGQYASYRHSEEELANIIRMMNNSLFTSGQFAKIPDHLRFYLDFGPLPFDTDPLNKLGQYKDLINENMMSKAEVMLKIKPELGSIEEAQHQIIRNANLNKAVDEVRKSLLDDKQKALESLKEDTEIEALQKGLDSNAVEEDSKKKELKSGLASEKDKP